MSDGLPQRTLDCMTGDFLPHRRQASLKAQLVTIVVLLAAAAVGWYLFA